MGNDQQDFLKKTGKFGLFGLTGFLIAQSKIKHSAKAAKKTKIKWAVVGSKSEKNKYVSGAEAAEKNKGVKYEYHDSEKMTLELRNGDYIEYTVESKKQGGRKDGRKVDNHSAKGIVYDIEGKKIGSTDAMIENGELKVNLNDVKMYNEMPKIASSSNFKKLDKDQQEKVLDIYKKTDAIGKMDLLRLLDRNINGKSALLDKDNDGKTLLENLHILANQELAPELAREGITRSDLLSMIMEETATPGEINQGQDHGTCTVTSMQYILCVQNPAEYARLMRGLLSPQGRVTMRNGDELNRDANSIPLDTSIDRSASERIFQSAMMEYCNKDDNYDNTNDRSQWRFLFITSSYNGLKSHQEERGIEALFGKDYYYYEDFWNILGSKQGVVDELAKRSPTETYVQMKWNNRGHIVVVTSVENGRVYFKNPTGFSIEESGEELQNPPRRLENRNTGEESMSIEDFKKNVKGIIIPSGKQK